MEGEITALSANTGFRRRRYIGACIAASLIGALSLTAVSTAAQADTTASAPAQQLTLDGVQLTVSSKDLPTAGFTSALPGDADQSAGDSVSSPFVTFTITTVPFGDGLPGSDTLTNAAAGGAANWQSTLATESAQGAALTTGPTVSIFGQQVTGTASQPSIALNGGTPVPVDEITWVAEAGNRMWIISAAEDHSIGTTDFAVDLTLTSPNPGVATTIGVVAPSDPDGVQSLPPSLIGTGGGAGTVSAASSGGTGSAFSTPSWWSGDCDSNGTPDPGETMAGEHQIASYFGFEACGRFTNGYSAGTVAHRSYPGGGATVSEFQCAELPTRWAYLAWGIPPVANSNGAVWARNYAGHTTKSGSTLVLYTDAAGPSHMPVAGDVMSMGTTFAHNGVGHVALVTGADINSSGNGSVYLMDQNFHPNGTFSMAVNNWKIPGLGSGLMGTAWAHDPANDSAGPPPPAPTGPALTIHNLTSPASGTLSLTVTSTQPLASEYYWLDGSVVAGTGIGPAGSPTNLSGANNYTWILDTTHLQNGTHTLKATGTNGTGIGGDSGAPISFTVQNGSNVAVSSSGRQVAIYEPNTHTEELFAIGADGRLGHTYLNATSNGWFQWTPIGNVKYTGTLSAVFNPTTNTTEVFGRGQDGNIYHSYNSGNGWVADNLVNNYWNGFSGDPVAIYEPNTQTEEVFALGSDGRLGHSYLNATSNGWFQWTPIGNLKYTGKLSALFNPTTNTTEVFGRGQNLNIYHAYNSGNGWVADYPVVSNSWTVFSGDPVAVYEPNTQTEEVFALGQDGSLGHTYMNGGSNGWQPWSPIGATKFTGSISALFNPSTNTTEVFSRGQDNNIYHAYNSGNGWVADNVLNGYWKFSSDPAAIWVPDTHTEEVFAIGMDGSLGHSYLNATSNGWTQWTVVNNYWRFSFAPGGAVVATSGGRQVVIYEPNTQTEELFALGTNGALGHSYLNATSGGWSQWQQIGTQLFKGTLSAVYNPVTNTIEVFSLGQNGNIYHAYNSGNGWVADNIVSTAWNNFSSSPAAVYEPNTQTEEVFAVGGDGSLGHTYLNATSNGWFNWTQIGTTKYTSTPSVVFNPSTNTTEVFAVGQDTYMYHAYNAGNGWVADNIVQNYWKGFIGSPSAIYEPNTRTEEVFAIGGDGSLGHIYLNATSNGWFPWTQIGTTKYTSTPSAIYVDNSGTVDVFARGQDSNIYHAYNSGNGWQADFLVNGWWHLADGPAAIYVPNTQTEEVFAIGNDGSLGHTYVNSSSNGWVNWSEVNNFWKFN